MIEIIGAHNTARCFTDIMEPGAEAQIKAVCDRAEFAQSKIAVMPDVHAGAGCTIGTTMTIHDKVVPAMVGVDIGCGMETVKIAEREIDFASLDTLIRAHIPCGREVRAQAHEYADIPDIRSLRCADKVDLARAYKSIGTLGGGNHFIELDRDGDGVIYLVVHSGSRHLGCEVAEYYQREGRRALTGSARHQIRALIEKYKAEGRHGEIQAKLTELKSEYKLDLPEELCYVEGALFDDYIHDMKIVQHFAEVNRRAMTDVIIKTMGLCEIERFTTVHNYIDTEDMILRKGAVSAKAGERLLIPINMRDGALICIGRGNADYNCSAPHGAGRLMSRRAAFAGLSMEEYKAQMQGIYSTCIIRDTLDESPMAYKSMESIVSHVALTADIISHIKPIYNFKASE